MLLKDIFQQKDRTFSFEIFPAKTPEGDIRLIHEILKEFSDYALFGKEIRTPNEDETEVDSSVKKRNWYGKQSQQRHVRRK